jgi:serine/threonine protein kinase
MRKRRLRQNEITFYAAELLVILDMLHCKNVVYRDLKPENVMVCETGHLKLIDFGLSKILQEDRTYTLCGSPEYMAPEVLTKQGYSFSVDYWALGVLIYELYCG